jgi:hypothetical protein
MNVKFAFDCPPPDCGLNIFFIGCEVKFSWGDGKKCPRSSFFVIKEDTELVNRLKPMMVKEYDLFVITIAILVKDTK